MIFLEISALNAPGFAFLLFTIGKHNELSYIIKYMKDMTVKNRS